jgi:hypothetical protein
MQKLAGPLVKYTSGAFPSHSSSITLASNFKGLDANALRFILFKEGWVTDKGGPTKKAATDGLVDALDGKALWNLKEVEVRLASLGNSFERAAVNQELKIPASNEPLWVNLGTIASYFSVSANEVGKWLDKLGLRDEEKMATTDAMERGLATIVEMSSGAGKNQTRKINHWNLQDVQKLLLEDGHYLNFDYEASLKGKGRNSDVKVETVDDRAKAFAREFTTVFKDKSRRRELPELIRKTPKIILKKADELIGRPGFTADGLYLKHLDRK